jgi:hypothetical protein
MAGETTGNNFNDVPDTDGIYSAEQADKAIRRLEADIQQNPQHPIWHKTSPVQEDWLEYQRRLYQIKHQDDDGLTPLQKEMKAGLTQQQDEQYDRVERGEELMGELVDAGFEPADIPEDLSEAELAGLETQLMAARGQWDEVEERARIVLEKIPALPASARKLVDDFRRSTDEDEKIELVGKFARACIAQWHKQTGFSRKPKGDNDD